MRSLRPHFYFVRISILILASKEVDMEPSSDREILSGVLQRDLAALAVMYDRYSPGIYRYAMRLLGEDTLAEECVAETFARFLKALRAGQGPRDYLQAYLYRIAHNWITDQYRRQPPESAELDDQMAAGDAARPETAVEGRLEQQQVRLALRTLTTEQRMVIVLKYYEGWANEEVAAALQKPVGAVKALQHRAMAALRRALFQGE